MRESQYNRAEDAKAGVRTDFRQIVELEESDQKAYLEAYRTYTKTTPKDSPEKADEDFPEKSRGDRRFLLINLTTYAEKGFPKRHTPFLAKFFIQPDQLIYPEDGDPESQILLGLCYLHGIGGAEDSQRAVEWFHKAAMQGLAEGEYQLGKFYINNEDNPENQEEGMKWLRLARNQGHKKAETLLTQIEQKE